MKNVKDELTKILSNKNTLTVVIVFAGILVLYIAYSNSIKNAIATVKVPYAKEEITSRTEVTDEYVGTVDIPKKIASKLGIVTAKNQVIGEYVKMGNTIPANSFFYKSLLVDFNEATTNEFSDIKDGYTVYSLEVDLDSTYGNSIYTGNYIDLYVKAKDDYDKIIFGRLFEGIKVLAVVDRDGNDVFESSTDERTPANMYFAVPDEFYTLLKSTEYISEMEVIPIPRNASYSKEERDAQIDSQYIESYIQAKTINITTSYSDSASNSNDSN